MSDTGVRFKEFSLFRIIVIALLTVIAILQFLTLKRMSSVSLGDLRAAKDRKERRILQDSLPLVGVYGTVEVGSSVEVQGPVEVEGKLDVNVVNEPLSVQPW